MCKALLEIMAPEIEQEVEERVKKEKVKSGIELLREYGHSDSEIKGTIMKKFHLGEEEVKAFL